MNIRSFTFIAATAAFATIITGCSDSPRNTEQESLRTVEMSRGESETVSALNAFSFNLFKAVSTDEQFAEHYNGNYALSPLSVSFFLGMMANGVEGETRGELVSKVLNDENADIDALNNLMAKLMNELPTLDSKVKIGISNLFCYRESVINPDDKFIQTIRDYFKAEISDNFNYPGYNLSMNNEVEFHGFWKDPFDKEKTQGCNFRNSNGTIAIVDMMSNSETYPAFTADKYTVVRLPYNSGAFTMHLFLPNDGLNSEDVVTMLANGEWDRYCSSQVTSYSRVKLPKFNTEIKFDLFRSLKECGLNKIFVYSEDFRPMLSENVCDHLGIFQKINLKVDEEGTQFVAITDQGDISPGPSEEIVFDRPFVYVISEQSTGSILIAGTVNNL